MFLQVTEGLFYNLQREVAKRSTKKHKKGNVRKGKFDGRKYRY